MKKIHAPFFIYPIPNLAFYRSRCFPVCSYPHCVYWWIHVLMFLSEAYRFLKTGLRTTGKAVYDLGVAAENMTAEATEVSCSYHFLVSM